MKSKERITEYAEKYSWVISLLLSAIAMYLLLLWTKMAGNGKYILLRGDGFDQFMGDIRMVARSILNGENPLYQFCVSMGFSSVLPIALEVINPFNILYLIFFKADFNLITIIIVLLKAGTIGASFHIFARKICKTNALWAIVFSLFYTMSAFPVMYGLIYIFWLDVLYVIPLCAIAVHRALYEKKIIFLTIVFSYIFITQFYMGYLTGIFGLLYYLLLLFTDREVFKKKDVIRAIGRFAVSAGNAVLISAVVWVPVLKFLLKYNPSDRTTFSNPLIGVLEVFNNFFWGEIQNSDRTPYIYCGIPCLLLIFLFFVNKKIKIREKIIYGVLVAFYILGCLVPPLYRLLHGFDAPDFYNYRFSFMLSFLLCAIACKQIVYLRDIQKNMLLVWVFFLLLFYMAEGRLEQFEVGAYSANTATGFVINLSFILIWTVLFIMCNKKAEINKVTAVFIILISALEIIGNGVKCINAYGAMESSGILKKDYENWENGYEEALNTVCQKNDDSFYRLAAFGDFMHNSDAFFGYYGVSDFCTGENEKVRHLMDSLGLYTAKAQTFATGMTPALEMLLSVKYELYFDYISPDTEANFRPEIKETGYCLPLGYMVSREALGEIPMGGNAFENQNELLRVFSGVDGIYEPVSEERIEFGEDGLSLSGDHKSIDKIYDGGQLFIIVRDEDGPVYVQLEQEKTKTDGIAFMPFENRAYYMDAYASFPHAVKLNDYDESTKYATLYTDETFPSSLPIEAVNIYRLNEENLRDSYNVLNQDVFHVEKWKNGYVKGNIDVTDAGKVLFTTIPLTDGWTVWIDGKKAEPKGAVNDTFMALEFPKEGHYSIELKYECPGLKAGIIVSVSGLLFLALCIFAGKRLPGFIRQNAGPE